MDPFDSVPNPTKLVQLLTELNLIGDFPMVILADQDGFPIAAAASPDQDTDRQSAIVALVHRTVIQAQTQLGMAATDEFSIFDANGMRLVCRPFIVGGHAMTLAILVADKDHSYRRATTRTIRAIRQLWSE